VAYGVRNIFGRAHAHAGSNPAPSASESTTPNPGSRRILAVANSAAGGNPATFIDSLRAAKTHDVELDVAWTTAPGDAERIATSAANTATVDAVVAVGGDGTVRDVASGLYRASSTTTPALFIAPAGTGNSNYRGFWEDAPWDEVVRAIYAPTWDLRRIDLGYITELDRIMLLGAGTGVIAEALITARSLPGHGRDLLLRAAFDTLKIYKPFRARVTVDDRTIDDTDVINISVGGNRYRAGNFQPLPHSLLDDGLLDISVLRSCADPLEPAGLALTGDITEHSAVHYDRGRQITIHRLDGEALIFEHDGDVMPIEHDHYTITVLPSAITVAIKEPSPACVAIL
jgi:diacylglycerol kinase (ATP)